MKVIYYSRNTLLPALLAAALHCHPSLNFTRALELAETALKKTAQKDEGAARAGIYFCGACADGTAIFVMTFSAPPLLVENSLYSLYPLLGQKPGSLLLVAARPGGGGPLTPQNITGIERDEIWAEVRIAVKRARLFLELM